MARRANHMRDVDVQLRDVQLRTWVAIVLSVTFCLAACPTLVWASEQDEAVPADEAVVLEPCDAQTDGATQGQADGETEEAATQAPCEGSEQADSSVQAPEDEMLVATASDAPASDFAYTHDPRNNPKAMADIVEDAAAVYGFRPSTEGSLARYAEIDWTDPVVVEGGRQERIAYHESIAEMYEMLREMQAEGATTEEIARAVSAKRNEIRIASYANDPEGLARLKARNLEQYGNENGGSPEYFYERYGSWETVIDKSFSTNSGMDACLGLYDDYYDLYVILGQVEPDPEEEPAEDPEEPDPEEDDEADDGEEADDLDDEGDEDDSTDDDSTPTSTDDDQAPTAAPTSDVGLGTSPAPARTSAHAMQALPATGDVDARLPLDLALAGGLLVGLGVCLRNSSKNNETS